MDDQERIQLVAAGLAALPSLVAVAAGDDARLVGLSAGARALLGDLEIGKPLPAGPSAIARLAQERYRSVWASGASSEVRGVRCPGVRTDPDDADDPADLVLDATLTPVRGPDGSVTAVVAHAQDAADRVREQTSADQREGGRSGERHRAAAELVVQIQDALLPKGLPVPPGVDIAARYLLAEDYADAGGDWFDAATLDDGRVALTVGDVVGHGVDAAATMGQLKTVFDERLRVDGDLAAALALLDRRARRLPVARAATLCTCLLDPSTGDLTYCTAGHPPPIVVGTDGAARHLPISGAGPLGSSGSFPVAHDRLGPHEVLVLYSDGLVERPGRTAAQSTVEITSAIAATVRGAARRPGGERLVERVCRESLEVLTRTTGCRDDITVLAAQRVPVREPLRLRLAALPGAVQATRAAISSWLADRETSILDEVALQHAVGELVTNAVQHAYAPASSPDRAGEVRVTVDVRADGCVEAEVADDGLWQSAPNDRPGRGLAMARGFVDDLQLDHGPAGTRATVTHRLSQPVGMLRAVTTDPAGRARRSHSERPAELTRADDALRVSGDIDAEAAPRLAHELARAGWGGNRPMKVDLSEVDLLCSAAVQSLVEVTDSRHVDLYAPAGSPAQHVLELAQLPYRT